ncbi:MAG: hypothetical protein IJ659_00585 [Alloprevotella sp.]|nr:hypothetical protein [Alloprevotella sp.]
MTEQDIYSAASLMTFIGEVGFLPLLSSGIAGFSAEEVVSEECRYVVFPDGGWDWPLWKWKGPIVQSGDFVYGKFFAGKAGFISRAWWPDFYNYRRSLCPPPGEGSIEEAVLLTLQEHGSLITRQLRAACGFNGPKMRSRFDAYVTRLQMQCRIVTEDFVYPTDRHGRDYGWGWSLLTTPEAFYGPSACSAGRTPQESHERLTAHLTALLPEASAAQIQKLLRA